MCLLWSAVCDVMDVQLPRWHLQYLRTHTKDWIRTEFYPLCCIWRVLFVILLFAIADFSLLFSRTLLSVGPGYTQKYNYICTCYCTVQDSLSLRYFDGFTLDQATKLGELHDAVFAVLCKIPPHFSNSTFQIISPNIFVFSTSL